VHTPGRAPLALSTPIEKPERASVEQFRCSARAVNGVVGPAYGMPLMFGVVRCCRQAGHPGMHYGQLRRSLLNPRRWVAKAWDPDPPKPDSPELSAAQ
jgi:hypothetical protein